MNLAPKEKEKIIEICRRNDISFCALFGSFSSGIFSCIGDERFYRSHCRFCKSIEQGIE